MLVIKDLDELQRIDDLTLISGGVGTHVSGAAYTSPGVALGTITSVAIGPFTVTNGRTSTLAVQGISSGRSVAHAYGRASAFGDGSTSHSSARYTSISSYRY
jgi:hypothetical protein